MRVGLYESGGRVSVAHRDRPQLPSGGLVVQTLACGLCSGELMEWYMDSKAPHILGHEVAGRVIESDHAEFPVGCLVAPHHHAPCLQCELCARGAFVHCPTWKRTRLDPGGMAEFFAVAAENLPDTRRVDDLDPRDAALMEPLACVMKSIRRAQVGPNDRSVVIGAGTLGLIHALVLGPETTLIEPHPARRAHAESLDFRALSAPEGANFTRIFVCPGSVAAMDSAAQIAAPDATILLFAPLPPDVPLPVSMAKAGYFQDLRIVHSYSCGPDDTAAALQVLRRGLVRAEQVVSDFVTLEDLTTAYREMRDARILKAMVVFS